MTGKRECGLSALRNVGSTNKTTQPPVQHILNKDKELLPFLSKTLSL